MISVVKFLFWVVVAIAAKALEEPSGAGSREMAQPTPTARRLGSAAKF